MQLNDVLNFEISGVRDYNTAAGVDVIRSASGYHLATTAVADNVPSSFYNMTGKTVSLGDEFYLQIPPKRRNGCAVDGCGEDIDDQPSASYLQMFLCRRART